MTPHEIDTREERRHEGLSTSDFAAVRATTDGPA